MKCEKCQTELSQDVKFCPTCGEKIVKKEKREKVEKKIENKNLNFNGILEIFTKPVNTVENNSKYLNDSKKTILGAFLLAFAMMLLHFLRFLFASVWVKKVDFKSMKMVTRFDLSGIKNLDFANLIFKQFFLYALFLFFIAFVFYIVTLAIKKDIDYIPTLRTVLLSLIPNIFLSFVVAPILEIVHTHLATIAEMIGVLFTIFILIEVFDKQISLKDKNKKVWFYVVCFSILYAFRILILYHF